MKRTHKDFNCVVMMHKGQAAARRRLRGMTLEEKLEYWRKGTEAMLARQCERNRTKVLAGRG